MTRIMARVMARDVLRSAASVFDVPPATLIGRSRDVSATRPRALACRAIRTLCPHVSYPAIGRMLDGRDHSTIVHNVGITDALLRGHPDLAARYRRLLAGFATPGLADLDAEITATEDRLAALTARRAELLNPDAVQTGADDARPADR